MIKNPRPKFKVGDVCWYRHNLSEKSLLVKIEAVSTGSANWEIRYAGRDTRQPNKFFYTFSGVLERYFTSATEIEKALYA